MNVKSIYERRFIADLPFRRELWRILCRSFFQKYVSPDHVVLEIGAGYCEFVNHIRASRKIAVDINPDVKDYADSDVEVLVGRASEMHGVAGDSVDVTFASNLFEHLERKEILETLREVRRVLKPNGLFMILQPNIRFCAKDYWMFFDHITPIDDRALVEALEISGFRIAKLIPRFLPFTTKSRFPKSPFLVRAYLWVRPIWALLGQQSFVIGTKG
jgi:SAM-dependent methyltransferase